MNIPFTIMACLLAAVPMVTRYDAWWRDWEGTQQRGAGGIAALMGESRRMIAGHFFVKADVYFHSGYYPSIFDARESYQSPHMAADASAIEDQNEGDEHAFLGPERDWIDRFGRRFFPSLHTHLDELEKHGDGIGATREILPWIKLTTTLDPHNTTAYVVGAYWLRERMNRVDEAEKYLREGWQANPESHEIIFELGRLIRENHKDPGGARRMWELALKKWEKNEGILEEPDYFFFRKVIAYLGSLEESEGHLERALSLYEYGAARGQRPDHFEQQFKEVKKRLTSEAQHQPQ